MLGLILPRPRVRVDEVFRRFTQHDVILRCAELGEEPYDNVELRAGRPQLYGVQPSRAVHFFAGPSANPVGYVRTFTEDHRPNRRLSECVDSDCVNGSAKCDLGDHASKFWGRKGQSRAYKVARLEPCGDGLEGRAREMSEFKPEPNGTRGRPARDDTGLKPHRRRQVQRILAEGQLHYAPLPLVLNDQR